MQKAQKPSPPRSIAVLLYDRFSNHCLANALEPFRAANGLARAPLYDWRILSPDGGPVTSSSGLRILPDAALGPDQAGDYLFVMPSYDHLHHATPANLRALRAASTRFATLVGMDTGAWLLAAAGLLNGRQATIHWDELSAFEETFPEVTASRARFVRDGPRLTCGGAATSYDLVQALIEDHHGPMLRLSVAMLLMHGEFGAETTLGGRPSGSVLIDRAVSLMQETTESPLPLPELARRVGCSPRKLEALFQSRLQAPPRTIYRRLRLLKARQLSETTRLSITEIALRCGYADASAMTRAFRAEFGLSPSALRRVRDG